jgi:leucyl-tRNA synthetase
MDGAQAAAPTGVSLKLLRKLHQTIAKITLDFEGRWHFNTCVAAIMELVNEIQAPMRSLRRVKCRRR